MRGLRLDGSPFPLFVFVAFASLVLVAILPCAAKAQGSIDPSLPKAPLPRSARFTLFPGYEAVENSPRPVPPLEVRQKFEIVWRKIFAPALPIDAMVVSAFDQATNTGPNFGQEWGAFGKRLAYNAANCATRPLFAIGIVPAMVHQDPRYFRMGRGSTTARRIGWVLLSQVAAFSDRGNMMPNYGKMLGYGASTALSNAYMPASSISFGDDMKAYGIKFGVSIGVDMVHEFDLTRFVRLPMMGSRRQGLVEGTKKDGLSGKRGP
jgi:hypothetical protein